MSKILIVEDEKEYRDLLETKLKEEKYEIITAKNGKEALVVMANTPDVDLILLDMLMPNVDGVTFFYNLKQKLARSVPIIILTNLAETAYPADKDIVDFIVKANASLDDIVGRVKKILNS